MRVEVLSAWGLPRSDFASLLPPQPYCLVRSSLSSSSSSSSSLSSLSSVSFRHSHIVLSGNHHHHSHCHSHHHSSQNYSHHHSDCPHSQHHYPIPSHIVSSSHKRHHSLHHSHHHCLKLQTNNHETFQRGLSLPFHINQLWKALFEIFYRIDLKSYFHFQESNMARVQPGLPPLSPQWT